MLKWDAGNRTYTAGKNGVDFTPGINAKHTTPEDIAGTNVPHTRWVLERDLGESKTKEHVRKVLARVRKRSAA